MLGAQKAIVGAVGVSVAFFPGARAASAGPDASVCMVAQDGCAVPGSAVYVNVVLGPHDTAIVGGQFVFEYDPQALDLLAITPGGMCDSASPFLSTLFSSIDTTTGIILYGFGLIPFGGEHDPAQPVTAACLSFLPRQITTSSVCLLRESSIITSFLVDSSGQRVSISNTPDCPTDDSDPALSCEAIDIQDACRCVRGSDVCRSLDTDCREGVCDEVTSVCKIVPTNDGGACDDGSDCTADDRCLSGRCAGVDCTNPSLCIVSYDCGVSSELRRVAVRVGAGERVVTAGQFSLRYDPQALRLVDLAPGSTCDPGSPFSTEAARDVDEINGDIFYAVAVGFGANGTTGPAVLACATFEVIDQFRAQVCLFDDVNPFLTRLVDETGQSFAPFNVVDCPSAFPAPITSCADERELCAIPTVSEWGLVILAMLLLIGGKTCFGNNRRSTRSRERPCIR